MSSSKPTGSKTRKRPAKAKKSASKQAAVDRWEFPAAIVAIFDEHRYANRLLKLLRTEAGKLRTGEGADLECMETIMHYFTSFPDRYHHPKEDLIFEKMAGLDSETRKTIARLKRDHKKATEQGTELHGRIQALGTSPNKARARALAKATENYADAMQAHMQLEEQAVFLPSKSALGKIDWEEIDAAIPPVEDPIFGDRLAQGYVQLMDRYLNEFTSRTSSGLISARAIEYPFVCFERVNYAIAKLRYQCRDLRYSTREFAAARLDHLGDLSDIRDARDLLDWMVEGAEAHQQAWADAAAGFRETLHAITAEALPDNGNAHFGPVTLQTDSELHAFQEKPYQSAPNPRVSWQAALTSLAFRMTLKPMMRRMSHGDTTAIPVERMPAPATPKGTRREVVEGRNFHAEWIIPTGRKTGGRTILHIPGGAFVFPASNGHRSLLGRLAQQTRSRALLVHYRLLPDYPFPAGLEDAIAAYKYLLESGISPGDIVLSGDSAGGCLALALLLALRDEGQPLPAACALFSPLTDLSFSTAARITNQWRDPMTPRRMRKMEAYPLYVEASRVKDPLVSPIFGSFEGLPPTIALVSSGETLLDDTLIVARKARSQGVDFEVEVWEGLPHAWPIFAFIPEGRTATEHVSAFFNRYLDGQAAAGSGR